MTGLTFFRHRFAPELLVAHALVARRDRDLRDRHASGGRRLCRRRSAPGPRHVSHLSDTSCPVEVPGITKCVEREAVDGREKPGHDGYAVPIPSYTPEKLCHIARHGHQGSQLHARHRGGISAGRPAAAISCPIPRPSCSRSARRRARSGQPGVPALADRGRHPRLQPMPEARASCRGCASRSAASPRVGLAPIAASTHPFAVWASQKHTDKERYNVLARDLQRGAAADDLRHACPCRHRGRGAAHRPAWPGAYFLPHLLALSTSSPFWQGGRPA